MERTHNKGGNGTPEDHRKKGKGDYVREKEGIGLGLFVDQILTGKKAHSRREEKTGCLEKGNHMLFVVT